MKKTFTALALTATIALAAGWYTGASAQDSAHQHHQHANSGYAGQHPAKENAYAAVMDDMHKAMQVETTGDADVDFVRGMIPHHEGAVAMAKVLKEKGSDPELQKLADEVIAAQEREIGFMKDWLKKKGY